MALKIYADLLSQPSRALVLFARQTKIPHTFNPVSLMKGEHFSPEYEAIHRFKKVPAIDDDGCRMIESIAILRYLARKYDVPDHWYPKDLKMQAKVDEFLEWHHIGLRAPLSLYFLNKVLKPLMSGKPADENRIANYKSKMEDALDDVENVWLKNSPYLAGEKISIADIVGLCEMDQPSMALYDTSQGRPNITAWMARVRNDLQPHYNDVIKVVKENAALMNKGSPKL